MRDFEDGTIFTEEGGGELVNTVFTIMDNGVNIEGLGQVFPEAWQIRAALGSTADWEDSFFNDAGVDIPAMKKALEKVLGKNQTQMSLLEQSELRKEAARQQKEIRQNAATAISQATTQIKAEAGVPDTERFAPLLKTLSKYQTK